MKLKISIFLVIISIYGCKNDAEKEVIVQPESYILEASMLIDMMDRPHIKVVDFRKQETYNQEHIPGAVHVWRDDLENKSFPYKGMMADKFQMEELLGKLGISSQDTIVVYDDNGLCNAARLWWILQNYDFNQVKLLHGGLPAWKLANGQLTQDLPVINNAVFKLPKNSSMKYYCSQADVLSALDKKMILLDTRTADEFSGKRQKNGALKAGRIPGGIHIDWAQAINYQHDKCFKSEENLKSIYGQLKSSSEEPIIVYCHTGMRSAHTTFVLTQLLGYEHVKNYDGSWTEWSQSNELPLEKDSLTVVFK